MDPINKDNLKDQGQPDVPSASGQPRDLQISPDGQIISPQIISPSSSSNSLGVPPAPAQSSTTPSFLGATPSTSNVAAATNTPKPTQPQNIAPTFNNPPSQNAPSQFIGGDFTPPTPPQQPGFSAKTQFLGKLKSKKYFLPTVIVAGVLLIAGSASAIYFLGVSSPEKNLGKAVKKTLQQENITTKGSITGIDVGGDDEKALKIEIESMQNRKDKKASLATVFELDGKKFNIDIKAVDNSLYIKLGDLNTLMNMFGLDMSSPALKNYTNAIDSINKSIGDQWIEISDEFIKQVNKNCSMDILSIELSKEDQELLFKQYKDNSFAKITSTKTVKVNDKTATQYSLDIDSEKIDDYLKSLDGLTVFKKMKECQGDEGSKDSTKKLEDSIKDDAKNEYDIWVDKSSGMISKVQIKSKADDEEIVAQMNFDYNKVEISKPDSSKTIETVVQELMQSPEISEIFNSFGANGGGSASAQDTERQTDIRAIHGQLEAFYAQNGFYPALANLNDAAWVSANFKGLDKEALKDPKGGQYKLVSTPSANNYAYTTTPSGCNECKGYKLTATLSNSKTYIKENL